MCVVQDARYRGSCLKACLTSPPAPSNGYAAKKPTSGKARSTCQVPGCEADLEEETKVYCLQRRICTNHLQAEAIYCPSNTQPLRFCLQCGKLEPLTAFDGQKRSCRAKLRKRRERRADMPSRESHHKRRTSSSTSNQADAAAPVMPAAEAPVGAAPVEAVPPAFTDPNQTEQAALLGVDGSSMWPVLSPSAQLWPLAHTHTPATDAACQADHQYLQELMDGMPCCAGLDSPAAAAPHAAAVCGQTSQRPWTEHDFELLLHQMLAEELPTLDSIGGATLSISSSGSTDASNSSVMPQMPAHINNSFMANTAGPAPGAGGAQVVLGSSLVPWLRCEQPFLCPASPSSWCSSSSEPAAASMLAADMMPAFPPGMTGAPLPSYRQSWGGPPAVAAAPAPVAMTGLLTAGAPGFGGNRAEADAARLAAVQQRVRILEMQLSTLQYAHPALHSGLHVY